MDVDRIQQRLEDSRRSLGRRLMVFVAVVALTTVGLVGPALASSYWWNGDRAENWWFSTHPASYSYDYLSVDLSDCGTFCDRWLDSTTSGLIKSQTKIHHWTSFSTSWLSCKWDTWGSGSGERDLECFRDW